MIRPLLAVALLLATAGATPAQHLGPYAGLETRPVKALSDQQIADLQAGRGMSLALAAELNGYPGPSHVLELADALQLTPDQRARAQALFAAMQREAQAIGADIVRQETALDRLFAAKTASEDNVRDIVTELGARQGALRLTHLKYHLSMVALLTPDQTARYQSLRGYGDAAAPQSGGHHHR